MFSKTSAAAPTEASPTCGVGRSTVHNQIRSEGEVNVAGQFVGAMIARRTNFFGGSVNGDVTVQTLCIEGGYVGRTETGTVRLGAHSKVQGQPTYRELEVPVGASLHSGYCSLHQSRESALRVVTNVVAAARYAGARMALGRCPPKRI
jgi:cytoskeletal protein CcmA (bactofilin family)